MSSEQRFLKNAWYMAAWSSEIGEPLMRRRLLGEPMVLYRASDGTCVILTDRCPHRFAPLSQGERNGDSVRCPYHGLEFDRNGACVHNPFSSSIPKAASVASWRVKEQDGIVWFWAGDPADADEARIPDFSSIEPDGVTPIKGLMPMNANYEYGTDNLMDLSHIEFVHKGSFAGQGVIFAGEHQVQQKDDTLESNWWMPNVPAPSHTFGIYERGLPTDHWLDMRWNAPAAMLLEVGATPAGESRKDGVIVHQAHILTPETESSTHYFWATTRPTNVVTEEGDAWVSSVMAQAFNEEDKPIIEAAYTNMDGADFWDLKPVFLGIDSGGTRARRLIQQKLLAERDAAAKQMQMQMQMQATGRTS